MGTTKLKTKKASKTTKTKAKVNKNTKPKKQATQATKPVWIGLVIDESNGMKNHRDNVISGLNAWAQDVWGLKGQEITFNLVKSNSKFGPRTQTFNATPSLDHDSFKPNHDENIFDGIGLALTRAGLGVDTKKQDVLIVVIGAGDGLQRSDLTIEETRDMIEDYGDWTFAYITLTSFLPGLPIDNFLFPEDVEELFSTLTKATTKWLKGKRKTKGFFK